MFGGLFQKRLKNTVGEGLDPPGGKGSDILSISAKTNRVRGRVKTLPYSKNAVRLEICKYQFANLPRESGKLFCFWT